MKSYLLNKDNLENINTMISCVAEVMQENNVYSYDEALHYAFLDFEGKLLDKVSSKIQREKIIDEFFIMAGDYI